MRHTILNKYNDYEVVMVLRNRFNGYLPLSKTLQHPGEGVFKNKYIDVLKSKPVDYEGFKCDENKSILKNERYELEVSFAFSLKQ